MKTSPLLLKIIDPSYLSLIDAKAIFDGTMPDPAPEALRDPESPVDVSHVVAMLSSSAHVTGLAWSSPQDRRATDEWIAARLMYLYRPSHREACSVGAWAWILLQEAKAARAKGQPSYLARRWGDPAGTVALKHFFGGIYENAIARLWILAQRTCVNGRFCREAFLNSELTQDLVRNSYSRNPLVAKAISFFVSDMYRKTVGQEDEFDTSCVKGLSMEINLILSSMSPLRAYPYEYDKGQYDEWAKKAPSCADDVNYATLDIRGEIGPNVISIPDENEYLGPINEAITSNVNVEVCHTYKRTHARHFYWIVRRMLIGMREVHGMDPKVVGVIEKIAKSSAKLLDVPGNECLSSENSASNLKSFLGTIPSEASDAKLVELGTLFVSFLTKSSEFNSNPLNEKLRLPFSEIKQSMSAVYRKVSELPTPPNWSDSLKKRLNYMFVNI